MITKAMQNMVMKTVPCIGQLTPWYTADNNEKAWKTNKQRSASRWFSFESLWVSDRMAEWKMNSLRSYNPFCSNESRAKSWGYKRVCISWHSYDHDVPLSLGAQFIQQNDETIQYSHFQAWQGYRYLWSFYCIFLRRRSCLLNFFRADGSRKMVSWFSLSSQLNHWSIHTGKTWNIIKSQKT